MTDLIYIILAVLLVVILFVLVIYNRIITAKNKIKNSKANIEIYLKKRFDLIPNLVETVKGYSKHESGTLEKIVSLRNNYNSQKGMSVNEANEMNNTLTKYLAVIEAYPELKANDEFMSLQGELSRIEEELERARTNYNHCVTRYNTLIETVPNNIIASIFAFKKAEWFETEEETKDNVKIEI